MNKPVHLMLLTGEAVEQGRELPERQGCCFENNGLAAETVGVSQQCWLHQVTRNVVRCAMIL